MMKKCLEKIRSLPSLPVLVVMLLAAAMILAAIGWVLWKMKRQKAAN